MSLEADIEDLLRRNILGMGHLQSTSLMVKEYVSCSKN